MAYRDRTTTEKSGSFDYSIMEVRLRKKGAPATAKDDLRLMTVDNHWETLRFVQDNMEECVGNIVRLKRLQDNEAKGMNESAALFQKNLEPLVSSLAAANNGGQGVMDKLSASLKKALLLMVMERYKSDREKACRVLGISREKLETELKLCGVGR
jgi:DNA-binding protein Fis